MLLARTKRHFKRLSQQCRLNDMYTFKISLFGSCIRQTSHWYCIALCTKKWYRGTYRCPTCIYK